jgi:hypothetical protein
MRGTHRKMSWTHSKLFAQLEKELSTKSWLNIFQPVLNVVESRQKAWLENVQRTIIDASMLKCNPVIWHIERVSDNQFIALYTIGKDVRVYNSTLNSDLQVYTSEASVSSAVLVVSVDTLDVWIGENTGKITRFSAMVDLSEDFHLLLSTVIAPIQALQPVPWSLPSKYFYCWVYHANTIYLYAYQTNGGLVPLVVFDIPAECKTLLRLEVTIVTLLNEHCA